MAHHLTRCTDWSQKRKTNRNGCQIDFAEWTQEDPPPKDVKETTASTRKEDPGTKRKFQQEVLQQQQHEAQLHRHPINLLYRRRASNSSHYIYSEGSMRQRMIQQNAFPIGCFWARNFCSSLQNSHEQGLNVKKIKKVFCKLEKRQSITTTCYCMSSSKSVVLAAPTSHLIEEAQNEGDPTQPKWDIMGRGLESFPNTFLWTRRLDYKWQELRTANPERCCEERVPRRGLPKRWFTSMDNWSCILERQMLQHRCHTANLLSRTSLQQRRGWLLLLSSSCRINAL